MGDVLGVQLDWGENAADYNVYISTGAVLGLTIGSIFSKLVTNSLGRRKSMLLMNFIILLVTIPYFWTKSFWMILVTRFILGIAGAV